MIEHRPTRPQDGVPGGERAAMGGVVQEVDGGEVSDPSPRDPRQRNTPKEMRDDVLVGDARGVRNPEFGPDVIFVEVRAEEPVGRHEDQDGVQPDDADADAAEFGEHDAKKEEVLILR